MTASIGLNSEWGLRRPWRLGFVNTTRNAVRKRKKITPIIMDSRNDLYPPWSRVEELSSSGITTVDAQVSGGLNIVLAMVRWKEWQLEGMEQVLNSRQNRWIGTSEGNGWGKKLWSLGIIQKGEKLKGRKFPNRKALRIYHRGRCDPPRQFRQQMSHFSTLYRPWCLICSDYWMV